MTDFPNTAAVEVRLKCVAAEAAYSNCIRRAKVAMTREQK